MELGYRIEYEMSGPVVHRDQDSRGNRFLLTAAFFLLFCGISSACWPGKWQTVTDYLIPGDPAVTQAAFSEMTAQLYGGESWEDAVVAFCREVVDGAAASD